MKVLESIKKNKKIHYILKALKHINDEEYVNFFLNREVDPLLLEFKTKGKKHMDKRFFVITETGRGYGFFAEVHAALAKLAFADMFSMTPIISWGKDFLYYESEGIDGSDNAYEYFFEQPTTFVENDTREAYFVCNSKSAQGVWIEQNLEKGADISLSYEKKMSSIYKKYVRLNQKTKKLLIFA